MDAYLKPLPTTYFLWVGKVGFGSSRYRFWFRLQGFGAVNLDAHTLLYPFFRIPSFMAEEK